MEDSADARVTDQPSGDLEGGRLVGPDPQLGRASAPDREEGVLAVRGHPELDGGLAEGVVQGGAGEGRAHDQVGVAAEYFVIATTETSSP